MSMLYAPPPPPPMLLSPSLTPPSSYTTHGSIGAVIGVLAAVVVSCIAAVFVGRLCSGRGIRGRTHYDMESWVETKCSSCVDGRIALPRSLPPPPPSPPPRPPSTTNEGDAEENNSAGNQATEESPASNTGS